MSEAIAQFIIHSSTQNSFDSEKLLDCYRSLPTFGKRLAFLYRLSGVFMLRWCVCRLIAGLFNLIVKSLKRLAHLIVTSAWYGRALEWLYERSAQKAYLGYCVRGYNIQKLEAHLSTTDAKISDAYRSLSGTQAGLCDETRRAAYAALEEAGRHRDKLAVFVERLKERSEVAYAFDRVGLLGRYNRLGNSV